MSLSQITTCKGRKEAVLRNINRWLDSGITELVFVDYACPEHTGSELLNSKVGSDSRLTVVILPQKVTLPTGSVLSIAGRNFNLCRARNIGSIAARHSFLFFLDADCWVTSRCIAQVMDQIDTDSKNRKDLLVTGEYVFNSFYTQHRLPSTWVKDGQCVVNSALFRAVNGYNEAVGDWGGESYDLYLRLLAMSDIEIGVLDAAMIQAQPHEDKLRFMYSPEGVTQKREIRYKGSVSTLAGWRVAHSRAAPGHVIGPAAAVSRHIQLYRGGRQRAWRPGEDE